MMFRHISSFWVARAADACMSVCLYICMATEIADVVHPLSRSVFCVISLSLSLTRKRTQSGCSIRVDTLLKRREDCVCGLCKRVKRAVKVDGWEGTGPPLFTCLRASRWWCCFCSDDFT